MSHPLHIAFVWHMHQPYYRDLAGGTCSMPWVRLHATKDYVDMVCRLEAFPSIHQTFNLVPSLLDQIEEYLPPANRSDLFLELSRKPAAQLTPEEQRFILQWFFLAHPERMIKPYPRYHDLLAKRGVHLSDSDWPTVQKRFRVQDYLDVQVWFNLAWIDPWLRRQDPKLAKLEEKGSRFTEEEKRYVLDQHLALLAQVIPSYRAAADRGQIELTTSPYYHPIMPLLCDVRSAHAALPQLALPRASFRHPEDAHRQLADGLARHQAAFGGVARGVWPPEGSVSEELVRLALEAGVQWIATDEEILWRTLKSPRTPSLLYRPHRLHRKGRDLAILFRDRELSDLVGFVYSQWDAKIAVHDFIRRLHEIRERCASSQQPALVSIILDGENAWEFYPNDGHDFFTALYRALAEDPGFRCVTVSEFLQMHPLGGSPPIPELFSGSWIDGNFATWIGHPEKNAAWDHLAQAREALDSLGEGSSAQHPTAWKSLAAAEGSDWMWWFGDTHFSAQAEEFDRLFRLHLANAYELAGLAIPEALKAPIRQPTIRSVYGPTGTIHPTLDGRETTYYEWLYAGWVDLRQQYAAMHRGEQCLRRLYYGFDERNLYVRIDLDMAQLRQLIPWRVRLELSHGVEIVVSGEGNAVGAAISSPEGPSIPCAVERLLELAVPLERLGLPPGEPLRLTVTLSQGGETRERHPPQGVFELSVAADSEAQAWLV